MYKNQYTEYIVCTEYIDYNVSILKGLSIDEEEILNNYHFKHTPFTIA